MVGHRTFHHALWNNQHVTLVITSESVSSSSISLGTYSLSPITEFSDLIAEKFLNHDNPENDKYIQASIAVLPWLQITTIQSYGENLKNQGNMSQEDTWKEASFILLQIVNALKILQAQGIEELALSLNSFVLCKELDKDSHQRLCVLQG